MNPKIPSPCRLSAVFFMADTDVSSPSSSMIRHVLGVALPVDASLNDSLGLDSVHSHVTADFGPSAAHDGDGPHVPKVQNFQSPISLLGDLGADEDLDVQSSVVEPSGLVQPLAEMVMDNVLNSRSESVASVRSTVPMPVMPNRRPHTDMEGSGAGVADFDDDDEFEETEIHGATFDGWRPATPRSSDGEPTTSRRRIDVETAVADILTPRQPSQQWCDDNGAHNDMVQSESTQSVGKRGPSALAP